MEQQLNSSECILDIVFISAYKPDQNIKFDAFISIIFSDQPKLFMYNFIILYVIKCKCKIPIVIGIK